MKRACAGLTPIFFTITALLAQQVLAKGPACSQVLIPLSASSSKSNITKDSFDKTITELALLKMQADSEVVSAENNAGPRLAQKLFLQKLEEAARALNSQMTKEELKAAVRKKIADIMEPEKAAKEEQQKDREARTREQEELLKVYEKKDIIQLPRELNLQPGALLYVKADNYLVFSAYNRDFGLETYQIDLNNGRQISKRPAPPNGELRQAVAAYHQKLIEYYVTPTGNIIRLLDAQTGVTKDIPLNHADFTPKKLFRSMWLSPSEKYIFMYDNSSTKNGRIFYSLEISTGKIQRLPHIPADGLESLLIINDRQIISLNKNPGGAQQFETALERLDFVTGQVETIHRSMHNSSALFDREQSLLYIVERQPGTSSYNVSTQKMTEEPIATYPKEKILGPSPFRQIDILPGLGVLRHDFNSDSELLTQGRLGSTGYALVDNNKKLGIQRFIGTTASMQHEVIFQFYSPEAFGESPYVEVWRYGR